MSTHTLEQTKFQDIHDQIESRFAHGGPEEAMQYLQSLALRAETSPASDAAKLNEEVIYGSRDLAQLLDQL